MDVGSLRRADPGLRALYFMLAGMIERFVYLKIGLAAVLVFVGAKMLLADLYKVPIWVSLLAIAAMIGGSIVVSLRSTAGQATRKPVGPESQPEPELEAEGVR